jgi:flagellar export protein FliJ
MTTFRFPLEKVLEWRRVQLRTEEEKLAVLEHHLSQLKQFANALTAAELESEWSVRKADDVAGSDLRALAAFQVRTRQERETVDAQQRQCESQIEAQRARLLKARKDYRVLEKLRERRQETWAYNMDRELENEAADSHMAKLNRARSDT